MNDNIIDTKYMFHNKWTDEYLQLYGSTKRIEQAPYVTIVNNAVVLPTKSANGLSWGLGGVMNADNEFVEESAVGHNAFGGGLHIF